MQKILTFETSKYSIKLENFEGPLDLLCTLIDKNKMDIYDIQIDKITDQYIEYINEMEKMNLEITSEFILMASNLLYLKSKKLLPKRQEDDEEEFTEEELIKRIIEYKKYKETTLKLKENYNIYSKRIYKLPEVIELPKRNLEEEYDSKVISKVYQNIIERNSEKINKDAKNIEQIAIKDYYTVTSKLKDMYRELIKNKRFVFNELFSVKEHNKNEVVTAFSGLLELSRKNKVITYQDKIFGDINVEKQNSKN